MATKTLAFSKTDALEAIKQFRTKNVTASSLSRLLPRLAVLLSSEAHPSNLVILARDLRYINRGKNAFTQWVWQKGPGFCVLLDQVLSAGEILEPFGGQLVGVLQELREAVPDRKDEAIRVKSKKLFNPNHKQKPAAVKTKPSEADGVDSWDEPDDKNDAKESPRAGRPAPSHG